MLTAAATASASATASAAATASASATASATAAAAASLARAGTTVRRRAWAWARVLGGAAILALLLWRLGTTAFLDGLRVINPLTLATAIGIGLLTTVFSAWRWCLVARGLGIRLPLGSAVADYYRALFLNAALPGGVLGDVHRAVRHGRDVGDMGRGVRAVVLERTAGQVVLIAVSVAVLLAQPPAVLRPPVELVGAVSAAAVPLMVVALCAVAIVAVAVARRMAVARRVAAARRTPQAVGASRQAPAVGGDSRWARAWRTTRTDVRRGLFTRRHLPWIVLSSVVVLAGHLATFVVAARAAGSTAPVALLLPLTLLALLAMALPLNVGGWGPREGVCAWAFGAAGLSAAQGLTVAVVYGLFAFAASLPGAGVLLARWFLRRRAARPAPNQPGSAQPTPKRSDSA